MALTDTDGDGRADKREVILSGFGHTDNGSLHGLTFGPDGLLYFTMERYIVYPTARRRLRNHFRRFDNPGPPYAERAFFVMDAASLVP